MYKILIDNASNLYPAVSGKHGSYAFRIAAELNERIDGDRLMCAVRELVPRFPIMYSVLIRGVFNYYHVPAPNLAVVSKSPVPPAGAPFINTDIPAFRIHYCDNRISVAVFHANGDAYAGMVYLRALLVRYFELAGTEIKPFPDIPRVGESVPPEELRDEYAHLGKPARGARTPLNEPDAYMLRTDFVPGFRRNVYFTMSAEDIKAYTKPRGLTVNDYLLSAVYASLLPYYDEKSELPLRLSVPINIRPHFSLVTLRNCALYTNLSLYPGKLTSRDGVEREIRTQMKAGTDKDTLRALAARNVSLADNAFLRCVPRALIDAGVRIGYKRFGSGKITTTLSNIGNITMPPEVESRIKRFELLLGAGGGGVNFSAAGYCGSVTLCASLCTPDDTLPGIIKARLAADGIRFTLAEQK